MLTQLSVLVLIAQVCSAAPKPPAVGPNNKINPFSDEFIDYINSQQKLWKAVAKFPGKLSLPDLRKLLGVAANYKNSTRSLELKRHTLGPKEKIPESFDSRTRWPNCPTIRDIHDQGDCSSCWAVSVASTISDRQCIHSKDNSVFRYSAQDMAFCCKDCEQSCVPDDPNKAWQSWTKEGVVSAECKPYQFLDPVCTRQCVKNHPVNYQQDKHYGRSVYRIENNEKQIQMEIMRNGPVVAVFEVYDEFYTYGSGVYKHISNEISGLHASRIIGWGVEDGIPYWLGANSWPAFWGDKGFFKILRGSNECDIEAGVTAGLPK